MLQIAYSERLQAVPAWRPGGTQINHSAAEWQLAAEIRNVVHDGGSGALCDADGFRGLAGLLWRRQ
jgi:hypothetical protein